MKPLKPLHVQNMKTVNLYSKRFTPARGWHWRIERICEADSSEKWLKIFSEDEPEIEFKLSKKLPKL